MSEKMIILDITGMETDHAAEDILTAGSAVPGAVSVDVSVLEGTATITFDDTVASISDFISVIDAQGYGATAI